MKNNRVFIVCRTDYKSWQLACRNAEKHVRTKDFYLGNTDPYEEIHASQRFEPVSPRNVLVGTESNFKKWFKLRKAMSCCSYVYPVAGCEETKQCRSLIRFARLTGKYIINEEEPL